MHELSIANSLVEIASEAIRSEGNSDPKAIGQVHEVHVRLGALAGVVKDALLFCYDVATAGTLLEGSRLVIKELPVVIHCPRCKRDVTLAGIQDFRCPTCGTLSGDIRQGRELELSQIHFDLNEASACDGN